MFLVGSVSSCPLASIVSLEKSAEYLTAVGSRGLGVAGHRSGRSLCILLVCIALNPQGSENCLVNGSFKTLSFHV